MLIDYILITKISIVCLVYLVFPTFSLESTCSNNCSTLSKHISTSDLHLVSCSMQSTACQYNQELAGDPFKPTKLRIYRDFGYVELPYWYLYDDPENPKYQKIALNISWSPSDENSIAEVQHYKVTITKKGFTNFTKYFCLDHLLDFFKHSKAAFFYTCFGRLNNTEVLPGDKWHAFIENFPPPITNPDTNFLTLNVDIPDCDNRKLKKVYRCSQENLFTVAISNISCEHRNATILYNVSPLFGSSASIWFYKVTTTSFEQIEFLEGQSFTGSYEAILPKSFNISEKYVVKVKGNSMSNFSKEVALDWSDCPEVIPFKFEIALLIACLAIIAIIASGLTLYLYKRKNKQLSHEPLDSPSAQFEDIFKKNKQLITVYIVFVDDHPLHRDIISLFALFLSNDLGFNVESELYQTKEICEDLVGWMDKKLTTADKVIVVWSPKALQRWNQKDEDVTSTNDIFTPVVKRINRDLFTGKNLLKYFFAYFDYCSKETIPKEFLNKHSMSPFRLMHQFEELYFRLKGIEMYAPGAVIKEEKVDFLKYSDSTVNEYGPFLQDRLVKMCKYVKDEPLWYEKQENMAFQTTHDALIQDAAPCEIKTFFMNVVPPPAIASNCTSSVTESNITANSVDYVQLRNEESYIADDVVVSILETSINDCDEKSAIPIEADDDPARLEENASFLEKEHCTIESFNFDSVETESSHLDSFVPEAVVLQSNKLVVIDQPDELPSDSQCHNVLLQQDDKKVELVEPLAPIDFNEDPMESLMLINEKCGSML